MGSPSFIKYLSIYEALALPQGQGTHVSRKKYVALALVELIFWWVRQTSTIPEINDIKR